MFEVNPQVAFTRNRKQRQTMRMRNIKAPIAAVAACQKRLAIIAVAKRQAIRSDVQIAAEDVAQQAARSDEMIAVFLKMEARRPLFVVRRKCGEKLRQPLRMVEPRAPDVYLMRR